MGGLPRTRELKGGKTNNNAAHHSDNRRMPGFDFVFVELVSGTPSWTDTLLAAYSIPSSCLLLGYSSITVDRTVPSMFGLFLLFLSDMYHWTTAEAV